MHPIIPPHMQLSTYMTQASQEMASQILRDAQGSSPGNATWFGPWFLQCMQLPFGMIYISAVYMLQTLNRNPKYMDHKQ